MKQLTIKKSELELLAKSGSEWAITKDAEEYIDKLAIAKDWIDEALDAVKKQIVENLAKTNIKTIRGRKYTAFLRTYGDRYKTTNKEFLKEVTYSRPDVDKIEEYKATEHSLPIGTTENMLEVKCTFRKK